MVLLGLAIRRCSFVYQRYPGITWEGGGEGRFDILALNYGWRLPGNNYILNTYPYRAASYSTGRDAQHESINCACPPIRLSLSALVETALRDRCAAASRAMSCNVTRRDQTRGSSQSPSRRP